jgi:hypothetical protein
MLEESRASWPSPPRNEGQQQLRIKCNDNSPSTIVDCLVSGILCEMCPCKWTAVRTTISVFRVILIDNDRLDWWFATLLVFRLCSGVKFVKMKICNFSQKHKSNFLSRTIWSGETGSTCRHIWRFTYHVILKISHWLDHCPSDVWLAPYQVHLLVEWSLKCRCLVIGSPSHVTALAPAVRCLRWRFRNQRVCNLPQQN